MDFSAKQHYADTPAHVFAMFNDPDWWRELLNHAGAKSSTVTVQNNQINVQMDMPTPRKARAFLGETLSLEQITAWQPADDGWDGTFRQSAGGKVPGVADGTITLRPDTDGCVVEYHGEFKVNVPILGRKLEQMAGPYVTRVIDLQEKIGKDWLASHNS